MSNLLVQTIKHTNNTSAQTIDTSGRTTVSIMNNDSTYRSDGGAVTQNLVQGLTKYWTQFNGSGTVATVDSFNQGGLTDNGTGNYTVSFTNNMNNNDFSPTTGTKTHEEMIEAVATSTVQLLTMNSSGSNVDDAINSITVHGDLA